ncbi:MAG: ABC transporter ATP-binding protein, partial [Mesorhizobium sp.]
AIATDIELVEPASGHNATLKNSPEFSALKAQLTEDIRIEAIRTAQPP